MKTPEQGREWVRRWTASVSETIRIARGKMSAQQLSDRCAKLGYPIPRSTIQNLEIGRKESISIHEVVVLAQALNIPPLQLIFPIGREQNFELLPDTTVPTWLAASWFTGEKPYPVALTDGGWGAGDMRAWKSSPSYWFRGLDTLYGRWTSARSAVRNARDADREKESRAVLRDVEDDLKRHREAMRDMGMEPGPLSAELAHLDEAN